jgi:hypothetical protein
MMSNRIEYHEAYSYSCRTIDERYYGNSFHYLFLLKMTINLIYWFCIVVGWTDRQTDYVYPPQTRGEIRN